MIKNALFLGILFVGASSHTFDEEMAMNKVKASTHTIQVPPAGGTRPVGYFGIGDGTIYPLATQISFSADASLSGGMYIKGYAISASRFEEFKSACTNPQDTLVSVYEWGFGNCDDFMTTLKASAATTFTATVTEKPGGQSSSVTKDFNLGEVSNGLYLIFENLLGAPVTFSNAKFSIGATDTVVKANSDLVFPAATVHMSAALVYAGQGMAVDHGTVSFTTKHTVPSAVARPTAVMTLSADEMAPERLGCALGFYFGWFKKNEMGKDVCKGASFSYTVDGDILNLQGVIKAVTPDTSDEILAGETQINPAYSLFQGDGDYTFSFAPHGTEEFYVLIPNRLDTPITIQNLELDYKGLEVGDYVKTLVHPIIKQFKGMDKGPAGAVAGVVLFLILVLVIGSFIMGRRRRRQAAAEKGEAPVSSPARSSPSSSTSSHHSVSPASSIAKIEEGGEHPEALPKSSPMV